VVVVVVVVEAGQDQCGSGLNYPNVLLLMAATAVAVVLVYPPFVLVMCLDVVAGAALCLQYHR
jgi:hypothetical protein